MPRVSFVICVHYCLLIQVSGGGSRNRKSLRKIQGVHRFPNIRRGKYLLNTTDRVGSCVGQGGIFLWSDISLSMVLCCVQVPVTPFAGGTSLEGHTMTLNKGVSINMNSMKV